MAPSAPISTSTLPVAAITPRPLGVTCCFRPSTRCRARSGGSRRALWTTSAGDSSSPLPRPMGWPPSTRCCRPRSVRRGSPTSATTCVAAREAPPRSSLGSRPRSVRRGPSPETCRGWRARVSGNATLLPPSTSSWPGSPTRSSPMRLRTRCCPPSVATRAGGAGRAPARFRRSRGGRFSAASASSIRGVSRATSRTEALPRCERRSTWEARRSSPS